MTLHKRFKFFHENAGYSTPPGRAQCALDLARAEEWAEENGVEFEWSQDDITNREFTDECEEYYLWRVVARLDGEVIGSLGGVDFGHNRDPWMSEYRRVVEAEIASEEKHNVERCSKAMAL